jgi:hypothetical protein
MILKTEIDLNDLEGWDGQSIASTIADEIRDELEENSVVKESLTTSADGKDYRTGE